MKEMFETNITTHSQRDRVEPTRTTMLHNTVSEMVRLREKMTKMEVLVLHVNG